MLGPCWCRLHSSREETKEKSDDTEAHYCEKKKILLTQLILEKSRSKVVALTDLSYVNVRDLSNANVCTLDATCTHNLSQSEKER